MTDTPEHIYQKQFELICARTGEEKFAMVFEMTNSARRMVENRIKAKNPSISKVDLKIEVFKAFYPDVFTKEQTDDYIEHLRAYHAKEIQ